jgi:DNA replication protein DnaC
VKLDALGIPRYKQVNTYHFDHMFGQQASQSEVYTQCMPQLVEQTLNGFNATVCAYGVTGSGKTHTMMGAMGRPDEGLISQTVAYLF